MRDIYYQELRKNCAESTKLTTKQMEIVINAIKNVIEFDKLARLKGILSLEKGCESLDNETEEKYFSELLDLVVDGTEPELISEYAFSRYFSSNLTCYEGIIYLIYFKGALMIQKCVDPMMAEKILVATLPENVRKLYMEKKNLEAESTKKSEKDYLQDKIDFFCSQNCESDEKERSLVSETSFVFENATDKDIQQILREVNNKTLAIAMRGLSGNARKKIFDNLSQERNVKIIEEMDYLVLLRMCDINEAVIIIINGIFKLVKAGEICDDNLVALKIVMDIYNRDKEVCNKYKERYSKLKQALDDIWNG